MDVDCGPTRLSSVVAGVAGAFTVSVVGAYSWAALAVGVAGLVSLVVGLFAGRHSAVTLGSAGLFVGVLLAGIGEVPAFVLLVGAVGAVLAYDSATTAQSLGEQVGRDAPTTRLELVRLSATTFVGVGAVGVAYGGYTLAAGGDSLTALVFLLFAAVLIASALR